MEVVVLIAFLVGLAKVVGWLEDEAIDASWRWVWWWEDQEHPWLEVLWYAIGLVALVGLVRLAVEL